MLIKHFFKISFLIRFSKSTFAKNICIILNFEDQGKIVDYFHLYKYEPNKENSKDELKMTKKKLVRFFYDESLEHNLNEEKILDENNETYWVYNYIYINNIKKELKKLSIKFISDQNGIRIEYDQENFLKIEFDLCMYVEELSSFF